MKKYGYEFMEINKQAGFKVKEGILSKRIQDCSYKGGRGRPDA